MHDNCAALHPSGRPFTVAIAGTKSSGRMLLLLALCRLLRDNYGLAVLTWPPSRHEDGCREFLLRHKALAPARIALVPDEHDPDYALDSLMNEFRPEIVFLDRGGGDVGAMDQVVDYTIHVVDGSSDVLSPSDIIDIANANLLVLNQTHLGPSLRGQPTAIVRECLQLRGDTPAVFTQARHGIGTIEVARQFLERWRRRSDPAAWAVPAEASHALTRV